MVASARQLVAATCPDADVICEVRDGESLGLETASFDAAFSAFGIFLFRNRKAGWSEAARVLRPGGWFATAVWRGPEHNELARVQVESVVSALPASIRESLPKPSWLEISTSDGLSSEVSEAGFHDTEVSIFDAIFTAPSPKAMWAMALQNPPMQPLFARLSPESLCEVENSVLSNFVSRAGGADRPLRFNCSCHFLIGRRG